MTEWMHSYFMLVWAAICLLFAGGMAGFIVATAIADGKARKIARGKRRHTFER